MGLALVPVLAAADGATRVTHTLFSPDGKLTREKKGDQAYEVLYDYTRQVTEHRGFYMKLYLLTTGVLFFFWGISLIAWSKDRKKVVEEKNSHQLPE